jgi:hypothetical protein
MRARIVLDEKAQALTAYHDARNAFAGDPTQLSVIDSTAHSLEIAGR